MDNPNPAAERVARVRRILETQQRLLPPEIRNLRAEPEDDERIEERDLQPWERAGDEDDER